VSETASALRERWKTFRTGRIISWVLFIVIVVIFNKISNPMSLVVYGTKARVASDFLLVIFLTLLALAIYLGLRERAIRKRFEALAGTPIKRWKA
jgi:hypothetical protein